MLFTNFRVFVTKNSDGAISYTKNNMNYKVYISKEDEVLMEIFYKYYNQLSSFKNRHYAIAKWIVRDIRARGYIFKAYSNNNMHMRPIMYHEPKKKTNREIYEEQIMNNLHRRKMEKEVSDFERLIH